MQIFFIIFNPFSTLDSCRITLYDLEAPQTWDKLDDEVKSLKLKYKRGLMPPTQYMEFKAAVNKIIEIVNVKDVHQFHSILAFLKYHPEVNEILLQYVVSGSELERDDIAHIFINPFTVDQCERREKIIDFISGFDSPVVQRVREKKKWQNQIWRLCHSWSTVPG